MKSFIFVLVLVLLVCQTVLAGGLNRIATTGPTDVGNGSDPHGSWFPHNLGSKLQLRDSSMIELGTEVVKSDFSFKDWRGKEFKSKTGINPMPYFSFSERNNENMVWGIDVSTEAGNGASFEKIAYGMDSETLVSGTYVKPYMSWQLTDRLSVGAGPVLVLGMETWKGPFDINRVPLPIRTDLKAMGVGVGFQLGAMYLLTDRLAIGVNYMSPVTVDLKGDCRIDFGPISFRDKIKTNFQFPDRLDFSVGYQPTENWLVDEKWLVVSQVSYWGYSKNSLHQEDVVFDRLPFTKSVKLNWQDNYALYFGLSRVVNDHWTIGGGVGYMSKAIDETVDFMTPEAAGFDFAGRIRYSSDDFNLTAAISHGWGENRSHGKEIAADIWTVSISGTVRF